MNHVPEEIYLAKMDTESFYTNIPNSKGIVAAKRALDKN